MRSLPRNSPAWLAAGAAFYVAAELGAAFALGFFAWGRAEALLFLAVRPWLLLIAALLVAGRPWRGRAGLYALALALAGLSESLLLLGLGGDPWSEMLRGWAGGALIAAVIDLLVQAGRRLDGRYGRSAAALLTILLFVLPGAMRPYEAVVMGPTGPRPAAEKPRLLLMTGLPIVWGEAGPFDPASRPAAAYRALQDEFEVRPIDYLDPAGLGGGRLLLLAQPRLLEPAELAALDAWVRQGGRALILADPALAWPIRLPLGDLRRPPPVSLLTPLLDHWGLRLEPPARRGIEVRMLGRSGEGRRLTLDSSGRFVATASACRTRARGLVASCTLGRGKALLVADADLLRDDLWTAPGGRGAERHRRTADNPLILADWLDRLAGLERARAARSIAWAGPAADRPRALVLGALPILLMLGAAALLRRRARVSSTALSTASSKNSH